MSRESFLYLSYVDGTGRIIKSAYDIWINLYLINHGIRPSFMIQPIDYLDPEVYLHIMNLLINYRDSLGPEHINYRLLFLTDPQGIIVTTYYNYYKCQLNKLYKKYLLSDRNKDILAIILGYPAVGELGSRDCFSIYGINREFGHVQILANIYNSYHTRNKLYSLYNTIKELISWYDPDISILYSDTQGPLTSKEFLFYPHKSNRIYISYNQYKKYKLFINSPERKEENWNTYFDIVFEIGYLYK